MAIRCEVKCGCSVSADFARDIITSNKSKITRETWKSKYNGFSTDYEPYFTEGFDVIIEYIAPDINTRKFIKHLLNTRRNNVAFLEKCHMIRNFSDNGGINGNRCNSLYFNFR